MAKVPENRKCINCSSPFTAITSGKPQWFRWGEDDFLCSTCYAGTKRSEYWKYRDVDNEEMAEVLPVGSNKLVGELWPK